MNYLPVYAQAIANALTNGYHVDVERGIIFGLKGAPLSIKLHGSQRYPTVPLVVVGMLKRYYVVPAHKVIAYALWGEKAFAPGIHVRHGFFGVLDISRHNLSLGTAAENEADKDSTTKSMAARIARMAQGKYGPALKFPHERNAEIKALVASGLKPDQVAERLGVSRTLVYERLR